MSEESKVGRKAAVIDWVLAEDYTRHLCTQRMVSAALGVSEEQLARAIKQKYHKSWAEYSEPLASALKADLTKIIVKKAIAGDNSMLRLLAASRLDLVDRSAVELSGPNGGPIEIKDADLRGMTREQVIEELKKIAKDSGFKETESGCLEKGSI